MDLLALYERMQASDRSHRENVAQSWRLFGEKVRGEREAAGVSLREMARRMELSAPTLSDLELGRRHWTLPRLKQFLEQLKP
jgi:predicted transcriptional regulator